MTSPLYSLRLRASRSGQHLCGAERIVPIHQLRQVSAELLDRALAVQPLPDEIHSTTEELKPQEIHLSSLPHIRSWQVCGAAAGRQLACRLLVAGGVSQLAAKRALSSLVDGPAPGGKVMRGAMIIDAESGERLEADWSRGVRVSRMDFSPACRDDLISALADEGLSHHRIAEALVLAGKVLHAPGIVAELCWSDDPSYLTGYVSTPTAGYQRISPLKEAGDSLGGRALFVDRRQWSLAEFVDFLERKPVLFDSLASVHPLQTWNEPC
ncbi:MAG: 6-carboxyhexanoate--CoA ligase [Desulfuromonas sp.]|nr:MAG: 6-carboxyhexanoate--CoA ligase [Desulfuromonas sp.]